MRAPPLFSYICHNPHTSAGEIHYGLVILHLSTQFSYVTDDGYRFISAFSEDWNMPTAKKTEAPLVKASTVWRDHQSRTCIVFSVEDDDVAYCPMATDAPFGIVHDSVNGFLKRYSEQIDYPATQAARLFAEYSRSMGATEELLDALDPLSKISEEERIAALLKASANRQAVQTKKAEREQLQEGDSPKAGGKEPKEGKVKAEKPAKEKGTRKTGLGARLKALLMETGKDGLCKHTDQEMFAIMQKEFDLPDDKSTYIGWYRYDIKRKGGNPPEPQEKGTLGKKGKK